MVQKYWMQKYWTPKNTGHPHKPSPSKEALNCLIDKVAECPLSMPKRALYRGVGRLRQNGSYRPIAAMRSAP
jgi:hypothetical protein